MIPLTIEENKSYHEENICCICKNGLVFIMKSTIKSEMIFTTLENREELLMIFTI